MKIIAALIVGLFTFIGAVVVSQKNVKLTSKITPTPTPTQNQFNTFEEPSIALNQGEATYFASPSSATIGSGDNLSVDIMLSVGNLNLSAGAMRIFMTSSGKVPLKAIDKNGEKEGVQVATGVVFKEGGWSFPINEAGVDEQGRLIIDLAFINLSPEGYLADGEITIASLELEAVSGSQTVNLEFDKDLSKLVAKNGDEVPLGFSGATFTVK